MRITMHPTRTIVELDGVIVRQWEGVTDEGIPVTVFVHMLRVDEEYDQAPFVAVLMEQRPPTTVVM